MLLCASRDWLRKHISNGGCFAHNSFPPCHHPSTPKSAKSHSKLVFPYPLTMLDFVGNIHMSLTQFCSNHVVGNEIHMVNCVASPKVVKYISDSETAQFHIVLKTSNSIFPSLLFDRDTQIFISGHVATSSANSHITRINVPSGFWIAHKGDLNVSVESEVQKALVSGRVYLSKVSWNLRNMCNSYVRVLDSSLWNMWHVSEFLARFVMYDWGLLFVVGNMYLFFIPDVNGNWMLNYSPGMRPHCEDFRSWSVVTGSRFRGAVPKGLRKKRECSRWRSVCSTRNTILSYPQKPELTWWSMFSGKDWCICSFGALGINCLCSQKGSKEEVQLEGGRLEAREEGKEKRRKEAITQVFFQKLDFFNKRWNLISCKVHFDQIHQVWSSQEDFYLNLLPVVITPCLKLSRHCEKNLVRCRSKS